MEGLTKDQKDSFATAYAIMALYDGGAEISSEQITALLEATGNTEVEAYYPIIFASQFSDPAKVAALVAVPAAGGGGGGGGGGGDAEAVVEEKEEEKVEEEEMDMGGGMDMFGAEEGAGGGDY